MKVNSLQDDLTLKVMDEDVSSDDFVSITTIVHVEFRSVKLK